MWFSTLVAFIGMMTDTIVYSIIIPIMPFKLHQMGFENVSGRVGWLLFAFSAGVVLSTVPFASSSERFKNRQIPLIFSLVTLVLAQLLLMLAERYWVMCVARFLQGVSSSGVFTIGLSLICDSTPEKYIGRQIGIVMAGFSIGMLVGPPVAGALDSEFGYNAPFYFAMSFAVFDLALRLLLIERKDAIPWGVDPAADPDKPRTRNFANDSHVLFHTRRDVASFNTTGFTVVERWDGTPDRVRGGHAVITPLDVLIRILSSPRAMVCVFSTFVYGFIYSGQETIFVVHVAQVYNLGVDRAGLAFTAAVIPTLISMPLSGYFSDKRGAEWVAFLSLVLGIPWWGFITLKCSLVQFLVIFAFETSFTTGLASPLMTELAAVSRSIEGVGYAHVYGAFNLAYGIGTSVGPVLCGQIYDAVDNGWTVVSIISLCHLVVCLLLSVSFTGERPLLQRMLGRSPRPRRGPEDIWDMKVLQELPLPRSRYQSLGTVADTPIISAPQRARWRK